MGVINLIKKDIVDISNSIIEWLKVNVRGANASGTVIGNSGGVDSAVVIALAKKAFPDDTLGVIMPCYSNASDKEDALNLADEFDIDTEIVELSNTYDELLKNVKYADNAPDLALANIKPRLRMTVLYYYAQTLGRLVIGTGNKSEITVGYFTKYGDGGSDLLPLGDMTKHEVWELASYLEVPDTIINKPPSAGLLGSTSDEEEMGFTYEELEKYLKNKREELDPEVLKKIEEMSKMNEHKRNLPPTFPIDEYL